MGRRFPRDARLLTKKDFERVLGTGKRFRRETMMVIGSGSSSGFPRLGLIVGRKVGKSHIRNRLKRILREAFRLEILPRKASVDLVVQLTPEAGLAPSKKVREDFLEAARELGLYT